MGLIDTEGKNYLSNEKIFADAFNFLLYGGRQVINPNNLKELDTTLIAIPYGNNARVPTQKYRDLLKLWCAMMDDNAVYMILGAELQDKVHYAMPVKSGLYDMLGYAKQVEEARRSYRKKDDENEMTIEDGTLKIKLTSEEFLSGFRKEDKLIPIITAVVYLSAEPWDAPLSLHEMLDVKDKDLLRFIPNYPINLISPANIGDDDFDKFNTGLGLAMKVMKHQTEKDVSGIIYESAHKKIDKDTAMFLKNVTNLKIVIEEKDGEVDMIKGMELYYQELEIKGAIKILKSNNISDNEIITQIVENFNVTKEYVKDLLAPKAV